MAHEADIAVVDYGAGNIGSVLNLFSKIGARAVRASTPEQLLAAPRLLLPGVGAFDHCMKALSGSSLVPALNDAVRHRQTPFLGICVGFQMLFAGSDEGTLPGLNWLPGRVVAFDRSKLLAHHKIPHMGWNNIHFAKSHPLFASLDPARFYFVHSYHAVLDQTDDAIAYAQYGYDFCCAAGRDNIVGVQFHPEKSHRFGMQLFKNFLAWQPA